MNGEPMIVDEATRRFWVMVDEADGTLWCNSISAEYDPEPEYEHEEVAVFTDEAAALRAAASTYLNYAVRLVVLEVSLLSVETQS